MRSTLADVSSTTLSAARGLQFSSSSSWICNLNMFVHMTVVEP